MPKIITAKRLEGDTEKAREYVKTHILFPSGLLGLIFMVAGAASLVYQFMVKTYSWRTFLETSGLLLVGGLLGWAQTRYHQYLLREHPGHFASRMKIFSRTVIKRSNREVLIPPLEHRGRRLMPLWYVLGVGGLFGASTVSSSLSQVDYIAAFLLPWAGFFWAKLFFWRGVLGESKK